MPYAPPALTVSQLNRQVRTLLESNFDYIWVEGEMSNFAAPSSGHWYFSLKDGSAQVRCAMFKNRNQRVRLKPTNGDSIRLRCRVSLYEGRGEFQLIGEHMESAGAGALQAAFERLKARLATEGLFDPSRKLPVPDQVTQLGVVTSPSGAAIADILTVLERRSPSTEVFLLPVAVQGETAAPQICSAIEAVNRWQEAGKIHLDALIIGRGGGSLEDLWAFNEESVARAIAASSIPIVSAVGHEVDFCIADLVADQRAATPSAAAELVSVDQQQWRAQLETMDANLLGQIKRRISAANRELGHLRRRLKHPRQQLREQAQRLDSLEQRLVFAHTASTRSRRSRLELLAKRLLLQSPHRHLGLLQQATRQLEHQLSSAIQQKIQRANTQLAHAGLMLDSLSPLRTLERGYAIVTDNKGSVITDADSVSEGDQVEARLAAGRLSMMVKQTWPDNDKPSGSPRTKEH
ncbi:MAG: exodeoxyribonuclease VII large subunit [Halieaceae bacterium]|jgi:exodeoxyribonuclease VII large subunit|nr:exodeoxyribonuclease VII large subunit [Halieaceae bacterium]